MRSDALTRTAPGTRDGGDTGVGEWRGVALIAATYVYFLIFAQFGFLKRLDELGLSAAYLKPIMAAMAVGGITASLIAGYSRPRGTAATRLRVCLCACGGAALLTLPRWNAPLAALVSLLIGLSLGALTVTLVTDLRSATGPSHPLLKIAAGTGLGYFLCNVPVLFNGSPRAIALAAAGVCGIGVLFAGVKEIPEQTSHAVPPTPADPRFALVLLWFVALIWLDSAAFFIIQNSPTLKAGTWQGSAHLWRTGTLHLLAALASAWLLTRRGLSTTLLCAYGCLAAACLVLLHPEHAGAAAWLYPTGVSLYSVALVAAPSFLVPSATRAQRARRAGWIYAIAGWMGSAMGIGMGQNLRRVPPLFVGVAGLLFVLPWVVPRLWRRRRQAVLPVTALAASLLVALAVQRLLPRPPKAPNAGSAENEIARGRRVYIAEGCIHCHSQYIRPNSTDVAMWGPAQDVEVIRRQNPPLIGNRRQGPDLSEVGSRRSSLWLRMHFMNPREVSYRSAMPSYASLFGNSDGTDKVGQGDALIRYLKSLQTPDSAAHLQHELATWTPPALPVSDAGTPDGTVLFAHNCATCHEPDGVARTRWHSAFRRLPPVFGHNCLTYVPATLPEAQRQLSIARIVKFGIPGTDMPGHEYLPNDEVIGIASAVARQPSPAGCPQASGTVGQP